jgi:hypothetical protein
MSLSHNESRDDCPGEEIENIKQQLIKISILFSIAGSLVIFSTE